MRARRLAWALWAAAVALVVGALVLGLANRAALYEVPATIITPTFATLGALIVSRRPANSMGWIFLAAGVLGGVNMFFGQYATVALAPDGPAVPGGSLAAWLALLAQNSFVSCLLFLVLLFPDGMLISRRSRQPTGAGCAGCGRRGPRPVGTSRPPPTRVSSTSNGMNATTLPVRYIWSRKDPP